MCKVTDVIFDLDGTLIDSAPSILECFLMALSGRSIEPQCQVNQDLIGPPMVETLKKLTGSIDDSLLGMLSNDFKMLYDTEGYKLTVVFEGINPLLENLKKMGVNLHIATNKRLKPTSLILQHLSWDGLFTNVFATDSRQPGYRNKADMLADLFEREGLDLKALWYVGDKKEDEDASMANAIPFIGVGWGYKGANISWHQQTAVVNSTNELLSLIRQ